MPTKQNAREYIPLLEALADGELEISGARKGSWFAVEDVAIFCHGPAYYRRKPKIQLREGANYRLKNGRETGKVFRLYPSGSNPPSVSPDARYGYFIDHKLQLLTASDVAEEIITKLRPWKLSEVPLGATIQATPKLNANGNWEVGYSRTIDSVWASGGIKTDKGTYCSLQELANDYIYATVDGDWKWHPCGVME